MPSNANVKKPRLCGDLPCSIDTESAMCSVDCAVAGSGTERIKCHVIDQSEVRLDGYLPARTETETACLLHPVTGACHLVNPDEDVDYAAPNGVEDEELPGI